jgi:hypothetical protein
MLQGTTLSFSTHHFTKSKIGTVNFNIKVRELRFLVSTLLTIANAHWPYFSTSFHSRKVISQNESFIKFDFNFINLFFLAIITSCSFALVEILNFPSYNFYEHLYQYNINPLVYTTPLAITVLIGCSQYFIEHKNELIQSYTSDLNHHIAQYK